ncbi:hypothetical protein [Daejeonella lutea]|uniref:DinB superfamily protein n=1 Tax=Daejeonella lutea TaxID=572036 RepID=A0A1T5B9H8_9SPHI|nr:hypothetical protein [Daejeonella lutea]SKB43896.1 hypothetical protein SAMN05661099_1449 [Daejeonella lutea]
MDVKTKSIRMATIPALYDMQTKFFISALEGISDKDAHSRLETKANHIAWLAGSLVQQRCELACDIDKSTSYKQQADQLFKDNQGIKDGLQYPSLEQFKNDWQEISPILRELLIKATDEQLDKNIEMPGMQFPLFDMITFVTYREANCIGQIALWRRLLGYEAMKYM